MQRQDFQLLPGSLHQVTITMSDREISFSPDKMLQGRLFSYGDAQRYRFVNNDLIPVNAPKCPFNSYHLDGKMRTDGNYVSEIAYNPNNEPTDDVCYQPGELFGSMTEENRVKATLNLLNK